MPVLDQSSSRSARPGLKSAGPRPSEPSREPLVAATACVRVCVRAGGPASRLHATGIRSDSDPSLPTPEFSGMLREMRARPRNEECSSRDVPWLVLGMGLAFCPVGGPPRQRSLASSRIRTIAACRGRHAGRVLRAAVSRHQHLL